MSHKAPSGPAFGPGMKPHKRGRNKRPRTVSLADYRRASSPTLCPPGSPQKIELMALRASLGLPLFLPGRDGIMPDGLGLLERRHANGASLGRALVDQRTGRVIEDPPPASGETRPRSERQWESARAGDPEYLAAEAERKRRLRARRATEKLTETAG